MPRESREAAEIVQKEMVSSTSAMLIVRSLKVKMKDL